MVNTTIKKVNDRFFGKGYAVSVNGTKVLFRETIAASKKQKAKIDKFFKSLK